MEFSLKNLLKNQGLKFLKFQMIPLAFCGLVISILTILTSLTDFQVGVEIFQIIQNPIFLCVMGIFSLDYIYSGYKEQLVAKCQMGYMKYFHKGFALFVGLFAAFTAYMLPQLGLLFTTVASEANFDLQTIVVPIGQWEIPAIFILPIMTISYTGIMKEIFFSMDDKKHLFLTSIPERSHLEEYLIKIYKFLKRI